MLNHYSLLQGALTSSQEHGVWADLITPSREEESLLENAYKISIPTREEMSEIEPSNRLYIDDGTAYLTATIMCDTDKGSPKLATITFILNKSHLITVRYDHPKSFDIFILRASKPKSIENRFDAVFGVLIDTIIDRTADILEKLSSDIETDSQKVFNDEKNRANTYNNLIFSLGRKGDTISKVRESLVSLSRMLLFTKALHEGFQLTQEGKALIKTQIRDIEYLTQHCDSLSQKVTFLHDATLGLVSLEQNAIIKIFSIASVAPMPPTLIASIYGMNFKFMPELHWEMGYPFALGLMITSSILPFLFFKWKGWL